MRRAAVVVPTVALDAVLAAMIEQHVGRACPTRRDVIDWTGIIPRRRVWLYLTGMEARGLIEIEQKTRDNRRRRMRVAGSRWTGWTARHPTHNRPKSGT